MYTLTIIYFIILIIHNFIFVYLFYSTPIMKREGHKKCKQKQKQKRK